MSASSVHGALRAARRAATVGLVPVGLLPGIALAANGAPDATAQLLKLMAGLAVVIGLVFVLSRVLPRLGGSALAGQRGFRVVASLPVGQRERVVLLEVGDRQVMLGVAPGRVSTLHVLEQPVLTDTAAGGRGAQPAIAGWLARTLGGRS